MSAKLSSAVTTPGLGGISRVSSAERNGSEIMEGIEELRDRLSLDAREPTLFPDHAFSMQLADQVHGQLATVSSMLEHPAGQEQIFREFLDDQFIDLEQFTRPERIELRAAVAQYLKEKVARHREKLKAKVDAHISEAEAVDPRSWDRIKIFPEAHLTPELLSPSFARAKLCAGWPRPENKIPEEEATDEWANQYVEKFMTALEENHRDVGVTGRDSGPLSAERWRQERVVTPTVRRSPRLNQALRVLGKTSSRGNPDSVDLEEYAILFAFCEDVSSLKFPEDEPYFDVNDPRELGSYLSNAYDELQSMPINREAADFAQDLVRVARHYARTSNYCADAMTMLAQLLQKVDLKDLAEQAFELSHHARMGGW